VTKGRTEKTQINKIRDKKGDTTKSTNKIHRIIRKCFENLYPSKLENLDEVDKFLGAYNQPKLNQEGINHLNRLIINNEVEAEINSLTTKKSPGPDGFTAEFYQSCKE
jgi:hypothetical protein